MKNIIAFPQDLTDLKHIRHFWSTLAVNDLVNVRRQLQDTEASPEHLVRARVVALEAEGVRVAYDGHENTACHFALEAFRPK